MARSGIQVALVDDDREFLATLRGYVTRACREAGLDCALTALTDPLDLVEGYEPGYDLIFLDIEMPGLDGMSAARRIRAADEGVCIIFVTNMAQYALHGYEVGALDFIVKPVTYATFALKFSRALRHVSLHRERSVLLRDGERTVRLGRSEVSFVEKLKNNAVFHTDQGDFHRRDTLAHVHDELGHDLFAKVNSGTIVNLSRVDSYDRTSVTVGGSVLSLSRSCRAGFVDTLMDYLGG